MKTLIKNIEKNNYIYLLMNTVLAAIDIGSNAIRLLINTISKNSNGEDEYKKTCYVRMPIRLGEDVFSDGHISTEKIFRMREAFQAFSHLMRAYEVEKFRCCATSAMREASNGEEVVKDIFDSSGIHIEIISGKERSDFIYKAGDYSQLLDPKKTYLSVDVGGGSTEIIVYANGKKLNSYSFKIGTVRLLNDKCTEEFSSMRKWLQEIVDKYQPKIIIGSGGNINKVHKLHNKKRQETISFFELKRLFSSLKLLSFEERMKEYGLNNYRADVIVPAIKIFMTVAKQCDISQIMVPKVGLSDGVIHQLYQNGKYTE